MGGQARAWNWYSAWLPNSDAANRKPLFRMQTDAQGGMVSKYFTLTSDTASPANTSDTLYRSPYSLCARPRPAWRRVGYPTLIPAQ